MRVAVCVVVDWLWPSGRAWRLRDAAAWHLLPPSLVWCARPCVRARCRAVTRRASTGALSAKPARARARACASRFPLDHPLPIFPPASRRLCEFACGDDVCVFCRSEIAALRAPNICVRRGLQRADVSGRCECACVLCAWFRKAPASVRAGCRSLLTLYKWSETWRGVRWACCGRRARNMRARHRPDTTRHVPTQPVRRRCGVSVIVQMKCASRVCAPHGATAADGGTSGRGRSRAARPTVEPASMW